MVTVTMFKLEYLAPIPGVNLPFPGFGLNYSTIHMMPEREAAENILATLEHFPFTSLCLMLNHLCQWQSVWQADNLGDVDV